MTLVATGLDAKRHGDGIVSVKATITDERTDRVVAAGVVVEGRTLEECKAALQTEVDAREAAEQQTALQHAVIGRVLARSGEGQ